MERAASSLASPRRNGSPTPEAPHQWTHLPSPLPLGRFPPWLCPPRRAFPTLPTYPTGDPHSASIPEGTPTPACPTWLSLCHCQLQGSRHCCLPCPHRAGRTCTSAMNSPNPLQMSPTISKSGQRREQADHKASKEQPGVSISVGKHGVRLLMEIGS